MSRSLALFLTFVATAMASQCPAQENAASFFLLTNGRILDVESGLLDTNPKTILIAGNKIEDINSSAGSANMTVIDLQGRTVLPGLIDLHSHLLLHPYDETSWNEQVLNESLELRTIRATVAAKRTLESGFTTIRDLGTEGAGFADVALRDAINQGIIPGPRMVVVTKAMVTTGGYGPMGFDPRWSMPVGAQVADGVAECRKVTRQQIAAGADWVKVYADYRRRPGDPSTATFSQEELNAIVSEATSAGIPVAAHATTDEGIRRSVKAGVKTIEHGYEASPETLRLMKENRVVLCPTLTASESMARYNGWNPDKDPDHPRIITARKLMRNALDAGVTIANGSDVGVFAHGDSARELELMFAYGMPVEDVIRSATIIAAKVLQNERIGQIKTGFLADIIVVDDNPLLNLKTLAKPVLVIKDGKIVINRIDSTGPLSEDRTDAGPTQLKESTADQIKAMTSPQIIEITETPKENLGNDPGNGNRITLRFSLELDGTFTHEGKKIAKGDLARLIAKHLRDGVTVGVSKSPDYQKLIALREWLDGLGVESVTFEVADND